jgi:hypothetical protein
MSQDKAIDRILELSAEAHTQRREAGENSSTFHRLTGAILAYGQALDLLTKLQKERYAGIHRTSASSPLEFWNSGEEHKQDCVRYRD